MNDSRQAVRDLLAGRPRRPVVAPLWDGIFAAGVVGKRYASEVTTEELLDVAEACGFDPILRLGADRLWADLPQLRMDGRTEQRGAVRRHVWRLCCPAGQVELVADEPLGTSATCVQDATAGPDAHDVIEWTYRQVLARPEGLARQARALADRFGRRASLWASWMTPFELCYLAYPQVILLYADHPRRHRELMELHVEVVELVLRAIAEAGWDGFHTAGPPIELIGRAWYDELAAAYLRRLREAAAAAGLFFSFHNCGHIRGLLADGTYNRVRPDLFETLAPPPMGELDDLRWARRQLDEAICTRGNMDLQFLRDAATDDVARAAERIVRDTAGYRHIVGTADEILAGTPVENVRALVAGSMRAAR